MPGKVERFSEVRAFISPIMDEKDGLIGYHVKVMVPSHSPEEDAIEQRCFCQRSVSLQGEFVGGNLQSFSFDSVDLMRLAPKETPAPPPSDELIQ
jgi:hypothetical protein